MSLLSKKDHVALANYKYKGGDMSYMYMHVLSPLAQYCVDYLPNWVAPNLITFIGLAFSLSSFALVLFFDPFGDDGITNISALPSWIYLYFAISLFVYQTLDNMDGKQARKTGMITKCLDAQ